MILPVVTFHEMSPITCGHTFMHAAGVGIIGSMRSSFAYTLLVTMIFASGYFFYTALAVCPIPITYRIGELDTRFGLSEEEARLAVAEAESVWEDATGQNLFTYDPSADFTVNFIYDERQAFSEAESSYREKLDAAEEVTESINAQYTELVATYDELQQTYEARLAAYEAELDTYNDTVASYNDAGGAPPEAFEELEVMRRDLGREQVALEALRVRLNRLVDQINTISDRGNTIIERYNDGVATYNDTFGTEREFTQGTYSSEGRIDIFTFADATELRLVLAHELGHALGIDHVAGSASLMYFLISDQPTDLTLSPEDLEAFTTVCGQGSMWDTIQEKVRQIIM